MGRSLFLVITVPVDDSTSDSLVDDTAFFFFLEEFMLLLLPIVVTAAAAGRSALFMELFLRSADLIGILPEDLLGSLSDGVRRIFSSSLLLLSFVVGNATVLDDGESAPPRRGDETFAILLRLSLFTSNASQVTSSDQVTVRVRLPLRCSVESIVVDVALILPSDERKGDGSWAAVDLPRGRAVAIPDGLGLRRSTFIAALLLLSPSAATLSSKMDDLDRVDSSAMVFVVLPFNAYQATSKSNKVVALLFALLFF